MNRIAGRGERPDAIKKLNGGTPTLTGGHDAARLMYATGAEFAEVRINTRTREICVPRIVGAFATGHIMNTRTARVGLGGPASQISL